ncbi:MAG: hypothetical protein HFH23_09075 [Ruminococcus sp.]|nr:hypothetical protein [Ruminococcus sp.]
MTRREEWERFKTFSFSTKVQYVYDNYLAQLIVGGMILIGVIIIGLSLWGRFHPDVGISIGVIDYDGFMERLEEVDEEVSVGTYQGATYEMLESGEGQNVLYALAAQISTEDLDALVAGPDTILFLQRESDDFFLDLASVYTQEELDALEGRLLYKESENGNRYPVAIDITDSLVFSGGNTGNGIYFAYAVTTDKQEQLRAWVDKVIARHG